MKRGTPELDHSTHMQTRWRLLLESTSKAQRLPPPRLAPFLLATTVTIDRRQVCRERGRIVGKPQFGPAVVRNHR